MNEPSGPSAERVIETPRPRRPKNPDVEVATRGRRRRTAGRLQWLFAHRLLTLFPAIAPLVGDLSPSTYRRAVQMGDGSLPSRHADPRWRHFSLVQRAWLLAFEAHHRETDRRNEPYLAHVLAVASYAVDDWHADGEVSRRIREFVRHPTPGLNPLTGLTLDEIAASLLLHDRIEHAWSSHMKAMSRRPRRHAEADVVEQGIFPEDVDVWRWPGPQERDVFLRMQMDVLRNRGMSENVVFLVDCLTHLSIHAQSRSEAVTEQALKLAHPVARELKRFDLRHNLDEFRMFPYQPASKSLGQLWKYLVLCARLDILPYGYTSWDDLPRALTGKGGPFEATDVRVVDIVREMVNGASEFCRQPVDVLGQDVLIAIDGRGLEPVPTLHSFVVPG